MRKLLQARGQSGCLSRARQLAQGKVFLSLLLVFGGGLESEMGLGQTELPPVSSHVWTVTLCDHA